MFLKRVWFIIAGVLLLGHTPLLAESYLRACKNGVVYYYFNSREPAQPGQAGRNISKLPGGAWIQEPSRRHNLPLASIKEPIRVESKVNLAAPPPAPPDLWQVPPGTAAAEPVFPPALADENLRAAASYLQRMLTRLGFFDAPVVPPSAAASQWLVLHPDVPDLAAPGVDLPVVCLNPPPSAPEPSPALTRLQPVARYFRVANSRGYAFPVAGPFSFRDTWGDPRSGGRIHRAVDIFAQEGTPVYAITTGVIQVLATRPGAGIMLLMLGHDGLGYGYMHLQAYAPGLVEGKPVRAGELIGYVGYYRDPELCCPPSLPGVCRPAPLSRFPPQPLRFSGPVVPRHRRQRPEPASPGPSREIPPDREIVPSPGIFPGRDICPSLVPGVKNQMDSDLPAYLVKKVRRADH